LTLPVSVASGERSFSKLKLIKTYLHSTVVYLFELKEDDGICRQAQNSGTFYLFHNLSPFVKKVGSKYLAPQISVAEMKSMLGKFKQNEQMIEDSVLIGCSDECMAYFALDLGSLEKSVIESELSGSFTELRKAFFQLDGKDAPLLSSAQALLRWHDTHQYCSKTGQPTQKNLAGSKRVCRTNGIIYYPQMSPVVITLVSDGSRCLLARQASFPKGMYSALAGFCDVGKEASDLAFCTHMHKTVFDNRIACCMVEDLSLEASHRPAALPFSAAHA
uniref:Nudix hydrolase 13 n=1 Tax=Chelonoidis abingdonii TaxID=106734 RepID=A0A8C0GZL7_CHEAB